MVEGAIMAIGDKRAERIRRLKSGEPRTPKKTQTQKVMDKLVEDLMKNSVKYKFPSDEPPFINLDRMEGFARRHMAKHNLSSQINMNVYKFRPEGSDEERVMVRCTRCGETKDITGFKKK